MNVFVLDKSPHLAAKYHCDKHVTKMCLEYAQLLCTAARIKGYDDDCLYRATHVNHPCALWVQKTYSNALWLSKLLLSLGMEHEQRFGTTHKSVLIGLYALGLLFNKSTLEECTPFAQAMPDEYKHKDPVKAYRAYYLGAKRDIASWKHGETPKWWKGN